MEIIARRRNSVLILSGVFTLIGLVLLILVVKGHFFYGKEWMYALIALLFLGLGASSCINILRTPEIIIKYDGEYLILREGKFHISVLSNVNYKCANNRYTTFRWGKLTLHVNGKTIVYDYVDEVEYVHNRLIALRLAAQQKAQ